MLLSSQPGLAAGSLCVFTRMQGQVDTVQASPAAKKDVRDVLKALGMQLKTQVLADRGGAIQNAAAFTNLNGQGPAIVYNPGFMTRLYEINEWAPVSVIAHEIGHHLGNQRQNPSSHARELNADRVSGCAMAHMDASEADAIAAMTKGLPATVGSPSHPGTAERVSAIRASYRRCKADAGE